MREPMSAEGTAAGNPVGKAGWGLALWTPFVVAMCLAVATYLALTSDQAVRLAGGIGWLKRYLDTWIIRLQIAIFVFGMIYAVWQVLLWLRRERIPDAAAEDPAKTEAAAKAGPAVLFASRVRARLAPVAFAAWSLPVWGFIGTVSGVTDAIQALRDMADRGSGLASDALPGVLRGLYEAFDTTLVGLVLVIPVTILLHVLHAGFDDTLAKLDASGKSPGRKVKGAKKPANGNHVSIKP
ncbi:MAG: MotA/TolQ/ExbB proton channel family protein [Hyphomicrobiaceae bacterium]